MARDLQDMQSRLVLLVEGMIAAAAALAPGEILRLDSYPHAPALPTLNGFLLGYPAVYLIGGDAANAVESAQIGSASLSNSALVLHQVKVLSPALKVRLSCRHRHSCRR